MAKKTKILFVINSLEGAGIEKSLVTLLNNISIDKYDIYLKVFSRTGLFMNQIPTSIHVLSEEPQFYPLRKSCMYYIHKGKILHAFMRCLIPLLKRNKTNNKWEWRIRKFLSEKNEEYYDVAIGYADGQPTYFVINQVKANYKVGWNHLDYTLSGYNHCIDKYYFNKLDKMVVISSSCEQSILQTSPELEGKTVLIENIIDENAILEKSKEFYPSEFKTHKGIIIVSIGRLSKQKGYDHALRALGILNKKGITFTYFIIGIGNEENEIISLSKQLGIEENVVLLHQKSNPYPYLKNCDIYLQTSNIEGKSIALEEAKILCKPIVITNFATSSDQIQNEYNGLVCEFDSGNIADAIYRIINESNLKTKLVCNLEKSNKGNKMTVISQFDSMINSLMNLNKDNI